MNQTDNLQLKNLKQHFPFFGIGSMLYAIFYTFCLYENTSGITYPFFVVGTLCYFFFSIQKLGVPYKKDSIFYVISLILLGISNCMTDSPQILSINKAGIFLLSFILILHTVYDDRKWNLPKYFTAIFQTIGACLFCLPRPFNDMVSYFDAQKWEKCRKNSHILSILIGIAVALPLLLFVTSLLSSADLIFTVIFSHFIKALNLMKIISIFFLTTEVFFCSYAVYAALDKKNVKEEVTDKRILDPVIAIVVTAMLSVLYLMFSVIQIVYLFIGGMQLPSGLPAAYTYADYAREGFFQLLTVCILNLLLVLICQYLFRDHIVLKIILTVISACTYIMIFSSAMRMIMYIKAYNLTFRRILVLWALAVIFFLMAGVTIFIYYKEFPLFIYGTAVVTVFYIGLSFSHPDYWIARYNLTHEEYTFNERRDLKKLSADAAPAILDPHINPDILSVEEIRIPGPDNKSIANKEDDDIYWWVNDYYDRMEYASRNMHLRSFNFSISKAKQYLIEYQ